MLILIKKFNWKLFFAILLVLLIPVLYETLRIFFVGTLPNVYNFSIAGNLQWIDVIFEILEDAFILPLFFTLRRIFDANKDDVVNRRIVWQILIITIIYTVIIITCILLTNDLLKWMSVQQVTEETIVFVKMEFISRFFIMVAKIGAIFLIARNFWKELIFTLFLSTTMNIMLDLFISSNNTFSLRKGIDWIAYNQLITTGVMSLVYLSLIYWKYKFKFNHLKPIIFFDKVNWYQYAFSGLESFVRNSFFIWFVIKTINKLGSGYNQGDFWVMSSFIWDWMLLPILTLSQFLNRDQAFNKKSGTLKERLFVPFLIIGFTIVMWLITIPLYEPFIKVVLNNNDYKLIAHLALISLGFYILFAINEPLDKILYGDGKAQLVLLQSIIINVGVYIPFYYLTTNMTIEGVALMMGTAVGLDSIITTIIFCIVFKKELFNKKKQK